MHASSRFVDTVREILQSRMPTDLLSRIHLVPNDAPLEGFNVYSQPFRYLIRLFPIDKLEYVYELLTSVFSSTILQELGIPSVPYCAYHPGLYPIETVPIYFRRLSGSLKIQNAKVDESLHTAPNRLSVETMSLPCWGTPISYSDGSPANTNGNKCCDIYR